MSLSDCHIGIRNENCHRGQMVATNISPFNTVSLDISKNIRNLLLYIEKKVPIEEKGDLQRRIHKHESRFTLSNQNTLKELYQVE